MLTGKLHYELLVTINCCFKVTITSYFLFVLPPSSLLKPSQPHNGPPTRDSFFFAPDTGSYKVDPPRVHLSVASIEILSQPSGLIGPVPLGDAHLSPLMRATPLRKGEGGGLGGAEKGGGGEVVLGCEVLTAFSL